MLPDGRGDCPQGPNPNSTGGLTAIAVNNRFLYYALAYYGRDYFSEPLAAPLKIWLRGTSAGNQAEASAPLTAANGQRVLAIAYEELVQQ